MTTYTVTSKATGTEITRYAAQQPVEQIDDLAVPFADYDHTSLPEEITDVTPRMETGRRLTKLAFVGLIGDDAFKAVLAAAKESVELEAFVKLIDWATPEADGTSIDLADPRTVTGLQALEDAGLIAPGRAGEILNG